MRTAIGREQLRRIHERLREHAELTQALQLAGLTLKIASALAYAEMQKR